jgi:hypothetical protein
MTTKINARNIDQADTMIDYLWDAMEALYLATNSDELFDGTTPNTAEDSTLGAYNATWEAIVALGGKDAANKVWRTFMKTLPRNQQSGCNPDGE